MRNNAWSLQHRLPGHPGGTTSASFSQDGRTLVTGGYDCLFRVWDAITCESLRVLEGNRRGHVAFWPGRERLLTGGLYGETKLWDTATWQITTTVDSFDSLWWLSLAPDGKSLITIHAEQQALIWNTADWTLTHTLDVRAQCHSGSFSPDGAKLALTIANSDVSIREGETHQEIKRFEAHKPAVYCAAYSPNGKMLASGGADRSAIIWDTTSWQPENVLEHDASVLCATFSPEGSLLATGSLDGSIMLWRSIMLWSST